MDTVRIEIVENTDFPPCRLAQVLNQNEAAERTIALDYMHALRTIMESSDDKKMIGSLRAQLGVYTEFMSYLFESRLPERAASLQARAISLAILAGVAILLGVLQLLALAFMAPVAGQSDNTVGRVINVFAFCGVSFDALGAISALWTSYSLILAIPTIENIMSKKQYLTLEMHSALDTLDWVVPAKRPEKTLKNLRKFFTSDFRKICNNYYVEAEGMMHIIKVHLTVQRDRITLLIIGAGLVFFFVSLFCFIIRSQPLSVWVSIVVVVAVTSIILCMDLGYQRPGWRWRFYSPKFTRSKMDTNVVTDIVVESDFKTLIV